MDSYNDAIFLLESLCETPFQNLDKEIVDALNKENVRAARKRANNLYTKHKDSSEDLLVYAILVFIDDPDDKEGRNLAEKGFAKREQDSPLYHSFALLKAFIEVYEEETDERIHASLDPYLDSNLTPKQRLFLLYTYNYSAVNNIPEILLKDIPNPLPNYKDFNSYQALHEVFSELGLDYFDGKAIESAALLQPSLYLFSEAADAYNADNDTIEALEVLKLAAKKLPDIEDQVMALHFLFDRALESFEWIIALEAAEKLVDKLKQLVDKTYVSNLDVGVSNEEVDFHESAILDYINSLLTLGDFQNELGHYEEAIETFTKALDYKDAEYEAQDGIAYAAMKLGDLQLCERAASELISIEPEDSEAWVQYIRALIVNYEFEQAEKGVKNAVEKTGDEETFRIFRAIVGYESGKTSKSLFELFTNDTPDLNGIVLVLSDDLYFLETDRMRKLCNVLENFDLSEPANAFLKFFEAIAILSENPDFDVTELLAPATSLVYEPTCDFECLDYYFDTEKLLFLQLKDCPEHTIAQLEAAIKSLDVIVDEATEDDDEDELN